MKALAVQESENYYGVEGFQPIDIMQEDFSASELEGFIRGNILKYIIRYGRKDNKRKESAKILEYAKWLDDMANNRPLS